MKEKIIYDIGCIADPRENPLLKMWRVYVPAGKRPLRRHQHIYFEITVVNEGSGTYTTDKDVYDLSKGDVLVFCSNEMHCITDVGKDGLTITNLHFDPQYIRGNASDSFSPMNANFCFHHNPDFDNRIKAKDSEPIRSVFSHIQKELTGQEGEYILAAKSWLHLILITLLRDYNYAAQNRNVNYSQMQNIQKTLSYIDLHFAEKITLQDLSDLAGLTPNYYCTLFKQVNGMTLWDYIGAKRNDKAVRLLTDDHVRDNMIDIAAECGYNNTANFNKAFKKITGMTPREYRSSGHVMIS